LGGISFAPYPSAFNVPFKRSIRARDEYICAICGGRGAAVHHIDYNKQNTVPENCITLCHSCHGRTMINRIQWTIYFQELMQERISASNPG
jgi:hypothetical protein